jgi:hypothetical protein
MGFKRKSSGGNFMPFVKFDARNGRFYLERRVQTPNGWEKQQTDITDRFRAVFDLANAQQGWIRFPPGAPPETKLVSAGEDPGKAPSNDHKEGFRVLVQVDGVVHEFMANSVGAWNGMSALHDAYLREVAKHPGEAPEVTLHDVIKHNYTNGSSFEPALIIVGWVPRSDDFGPVIERAPRHQHQNEQLPQHQPQQHQPHRQQKPPQQQRQHGDLDDEIAW